MQPTQSQSSQTPTVSAAVSWGILMTLFSTVIPQTLVELTCPEKSLGAAITLAVITPLAPEGVKVAFNHSHLLKKPFEFRPNYTAMEVTVLFLLALMLHYDLSKQYKNISPLGYNAIIMVTGTILKLMEEFLRKPQHLEGAGAPLLQADRDDYQVEEGPSTAEGEALFNEDHQETVNVIPLHIARFIILFCATNAGGKFFEAMHIPLAEGLEAAGLTNFFALIMFSMFFNEFLGSGLFVLSDIFKEIHPNFISQIFTIVAMTSLFQSVNVLNDMTMVNFTVAFITAFFTHLLVQETGLGKKIDDTVMPCLKGIGAQLAKGYAAVTRNLCGDYTALPQHRG